jgi:23S rRNA pseudouridine2605 synthase
MTSTGLKERVQKIIARVGLASRRNAETLISDGQVTINGKVAKLGDQATLGVDAIKVQGKLIQATKIDQRKYVIFYKPRGVICMMTTDHDQNRATLLDFPLAKQKPAVFPVGRMDFNGEGLVFLTNDGDLTDKIQKNKDIVRAYQVKIKGFVDEEKLERLRRGGRIANEFMKPLRVQVTDKLASKSQIELLFQGMGSVLVKEYMESRGFLVERVIRVGFGHLRLKGMKPGEHREVHTQSALNLLERPEWGEKAHREVWGTHVVANAEVAKAEAKAAKIRDPRIPQPRNPDRASRPERPTSSRPSSRPGSSSSRQKPARVFETRGEMTYEKKFERKFDNKGYKKRSDRPSSARAGSRPGSRPSGKPGGRSMGKVRRKSA